MLLLIFLSLQKKGSMRTNYYDDDFKRARWDCLDRLLSDGIPRTMDTLIRLTKKELAKVIGNSRFSISTATFRNDIDEFRSALEKAGKGDMLVRERYVAINGEVNSDRRKRTYCYREKGFRAMGYLNNGMTNGEFRNLKKAIEKMAGALDERVFTEIEFTLLSRIEADYKKGINRVQYEDNKWLKGREYRPVIYRAIREQKILHIVYQSFGGRETTFDIHPYLLKQYNDRWYVFGLKEGTDNPYWIVPLDRIVKEPVDKGQYIETCPVDYLQYFNNIVGVSKSKKDRPRPIMIKIDDIDAWGRITTKPLPSQREIEPFDKTAGYGRISLNLIVNEELLSKIRSWGEHVVIESPQFVRKRMRDTLCKMLSMYSEQSQKL
jgi:predicted DNA-binding transcriptional regulator YafY